MGFGTLLMPRGPYYEGQTPRLGQVSLCDPKLDPFDVKKLASSEYVCKGILKRFDPREGHRKTEQGAWRYKQHSRSYR